MDAVGATLTLLAGLWASMTLFLTTTKELNQLRDAVLTGKHRGDVIDIDHRRLLLRSDWTPLFGVLVFICVAFAFVAAVLACSSGPAAGNLLVTLCSGAASAASLLSGVIWTHYGLIDIRVMQERLERDSQRDAAQRLQSTAPTAASIS